MKDQKKSPYIRDKGKLEFVDEDRLEIVCDIDKARLVVSASRTAHSYEEPAIDIISLIEEKSL